MNQGYDFGKRPMSVAEDGPRCEALRLARKRCGKDKEGLYILKITCGLDSQYRTRIADLMDLFVFNNPEPFEAV